MKINAGSAYGEAPGERVKMSEDYAELEVVAPSSGSSHHLFEEWLLNEGVDCQESIKRILCAHRQLFVDQLSARLPPERVINHTIMFLPGKMPSKGVLYRLNKDEFEAQREIIQNLMNAKWITMTSSPFATPAMMIGKKDDRSVPAMCEEWKKSAVARTTEADGHAAPGTVHAEGDSQLSEER
ncbi:hypothetical protein EBH_0054440 [Eimeria brunetti]|uniref:Uncharacterized protein n=1 Tax=Eimeria brunetti TaxID=51314 RepID=U6LSG0_9EIME|nr:hypothetical protein EBH_0054440 [Eimeria brunetti]